MYLRLTLPLEPRSLPHRVNKASNSVADETSLKVREWRKKTTIFLRTSLVSGATSTAITKNKEAKTVNHTFEAKLPMLLIKISVYGVGRNLGRGRE